MTAAQKQGALLLLVVLVCILGWRWRVAQLEKEKSLPEIEEVDERRDQAHEKGEKGRSPGEETGEESTTEKVLVELNSADTTELMKVRGIGSVFANRIVKYRKLIGGFQSEDQLLKVYGITPDRFERISTQVYVDTLNEAFRKYSEPPPPPPEPGNFKVPEPDPMTEEELVREILPYPGPDEFIGPSVNLNTADSTELVKVSGIGPSTARNIVKYRRLIYFFHSLDQLSEVWGIRPENQERMMPQLNLHGSTQHFPHIEVNVQDVNGLAQHKYLGFKEARLIVAYREQHGPYTSTKDLEQIHAIDKSLWIRLAPYIRF